MSVGLNLVTYTPTDPSAADDVKQTGDIGQIQKSELDGNTLTITTSKGTFVFDTSGLEEPHDVSPQDLSDAAAALGNLKTDDAIMMDVFNLMGLLHQTANLQREMGREVRNAERDIQVAEINKEVDELKAAAAVAMAMGIAAGVVQIAGGAFQVKFSADINVGQAAGSIGGGVSGVLNSIGQGVSGIMQADAKLDEAEATKADAKAQEMNDFINAMRDLIHDVQEKLQSILQSQNDTMKQILRA